MSEPEDPAPGGDQRRDRPDGRDAELRLHHAAAHNLARWHESSLDALGLASTWTPSWWLCSLPAPNIYHSAVSLRAPSSARDATMMIDELAAHQALPTSHYTSVGESWDQLDLYPVGLDRRTRGHWFVRPPAPLDDRSNPTALRIVRVGDASTLEQFEATVVAGFGARSPVARFDIHAPGILDDPDHTAFLAFDDEGPVACAMAFRTTVLGIYGVATVPRARRRGYASAITRAALRTDLTVPAILQPSLEAMSLYGRLGFTSFATHAHWA